MKINTCIKPFLILASLAGLTASAQASIVITEVMSSSAHAGGSNNADWFELTNTGASAVDITNWTWDDDTFTTRGNFGSLTSIAAGQSVIINGETVGEEASWISNWGLSGVTVVNLGGTVFQSFGSGGDEVNIFNAANELVTSVSFGAATSGFSFEWDTSGQSLVLSVLGENGAFQAVSNGQNTGLGAGVDIASPGVAVPEPASFAALAGAAVMGMAAVRRRRRA